MSSEVEEMVERVIEDMKAAPVRKAVRGAIQEVQKAGLPVGTKRQRQDGTYVKQPDGTWRREPSDGDEDGSDDEAEGSSEEEQLSALQDEFPAANVERVPMDGEPVSVETTEDSTIISGDKGRVLAEVTHWNPRTRVNTAKRLLERFEEMGAQPE